MHGSIGCGLDVGDELSFVVELDAAQGILLVMLLDPILVLIVVRHVVVVLVVEHLRVAEVYCLDIEGFRSWARLKPWVDIVQLELTASDLGFGSDPLLNMGHLQHPFEFVFFKHGLKPRFLRVIMCVEELTLHDLETKQHLPPCQEPEDGSRADVSVLSIGVIVPALESKGIFCRDVIGNP